MSVAVENVAFNLANFEDTWGPFKKPSVCSRQGVASYFSVLPSVPISGFIARFVRPPPAETWPFLPLFACSLQGLLLFIFSWALQFCIDMFSNRPAFKGAPMWTEEFFLPLTKLQSTSILSKTRALCVLYFVFVFSGVQWQHFERAKKPHSIVCAYFLYSLEPVQGVMSAITFAQKQF